MSISTYFRPNILQNGPEILGVNMVISTLFAFLTDMKMSWNFFFKKRFWLFLQVKVKVFFLNYLIIAQQ
jgi:hypothetical protein